MGDQHGTSTTGVHRGLLTARSGLGQSFASLCAGSLVVVVMVIGLHLAGYDAVAAIRDGRLSEHSEAGVISDLGILLMCLAGLAAMSAAVRARSLPLAGLTAFCWLFALDDAAMLHEAAGPAWEVVFLVGHGLLAVIVLVLFTGARGRPPWPIVVAIAAFAASVLVDLSWMRLVGHLDVQERAVRFWRRVGFVLEDVPKFAGIVVFTSFAIGETLSVWKGRHPRDPS